MTCPIDELKPFFPDWDVDYLCWFIDCPECTAEPGEGALWRLACPPPEPPSEPFEADYDGIPF